MLSLFASLSLCATPPPPVYWDGRDDRTLLPQQLVNRNLPGQLDPSRLGDELAPFSAAADILLSTEVTLDNESPTPFHGFFFTNAFFSIAILDVVDVNLNLFVLGQTASGGYRLTSDIIPGFAAHLHLPIMEISGEPVLFDVLASDLDVVTLGEGLLLETTPLEGFMGGVRWNGLELRALFGGRIFWPEDDLLHFSFTAFDGLLGAHYTMWFSGYKVKDRAGNFANGHYASVHGRWLPFEGGSIAAEYIARLGGPRPIAHGVLARADVLQRFGDVEMHAGYQFRYYQTGFGPFDQLWTPMTTPATPLREDFYATNSFEYLGLTPFFDQWSHTAMLEMRIHLEPFELFGELEWWVRFVSDEEKDPARPVNTAGGDLVPGLLNQLWYRGGVRLYPFDELPHRVVAFVSNKSVFALAGASFPVRERFIDRAIFFIEAEMSL